VPELTEIVCYDDQAGAVRVCTDQHVVWARGLTSALQFRSDLAVMRRCLGGEWQGFKPGNELLDRLKILYRASRFLDTVMQFGQGDRRDADLLGPPI
jgi:hypothetical protein